VIKNDILQFITGFMLPVTSEQVSFIAVKRFPYFCLFFVAIALFKKGSPYSITERRVPELIPVLGSQPACDVSHKPGGSLLLLSARPAVTPQPLIGLLPILLLGEQRHNGCKQLA